MQILSFFGIAMIAVCSGADAQSIHKCVGKDGKTAYSNEPCPGSKEIEVSRPPAVKGADARKDSAARPPEAGAAVFPELKTGKWKLRVVSKGRTRDSEMCGDPICGFSRKVQEYAATTIAHSRK